MLNLEYRDMREPKCHFLEIFEMKRSPNWNHRNIADFVKVTDPCGSRIPQPPILPFARRHNRRTMREFGKAAISAVGFKSSFKVVSERDTESILSLVVTKVPERSWTTPGRVLGNLAYIGSMVTLHLMKNRTELHLYHKLRAYELSLMADKIK